MLRVLWESVGHSEQRGGRLVVSETSEPKHFNPVTAVDWATKTVVGLLMADLLHIDREDQKVYPNLASDWDVSEDGRSYTLTLREGVRFSDGHPVDVDDVLFSLRVNLDEAINSPQRGLFIVGGEPIRARKLGARRIAFELAEPYAAGERLFDSFYVLPRHRLEEPMRAASSRARGAFSRIRSASSARGASGCFDERPRDTCRNDNESIW